jgi:hypothetical protein
MKNRAYFTKRGLTKRIILHEFYHHLMEAKEIEITEKIEENDANCYSRKFLCNDSVRLRYMTFSIRHKSDLTVRFNNS